MILRADNIVKKYRKRTVVKGVSFQVEQGEIVGLLGPNGARITSYNVCYTKLLRIFAHRSIKIRKMRQLILKSRNYLST